MCFFRNQLFTGFIDFLMGVSLAFGQNIDVAILVLYNIVNFGQ